MTSTDQLIETDTYPIAERDGPSYKQLVAHARRQLQANNCIRMPRFVKGQCLASMQEEASRLASLGTYTSGEFNAWFGDPLADTPADHPTRRLFPRRHGMIRGDRFATNDTIKSLFRNEDLCRFVADCLEYAHLYPYADPYGCVNVNIQPADVEFAWHYDHNDFTVSIGLKQPGQGGQFEFVPNLRTETDENYAGVQRVLDGDRSAVQTLTLEPGDLQLFRGKHTLHRVTAPCEERHCLLLSYSSQPEHIASVAYAERLWGEAHTLHHSQKIA